MGQQIKSKVTPGDWITIGKEKRKSAVVCNVYNEYIEVVYLDDRNRAINEDVVWKDNVWEFKIKGPCGGYADNYSRLNKYVAILKHGRYKN